MDRKRHYSSESVRIYSDDEGSDSSTGLNDWDYNYKLERGRLISKPVYSSRCSHSSSPTHPKFIHKTEFRKSNRQFSFPPFLETTMPKKRSPNALWYDPDPPSQKIDVKSDADFLTSLHPGGPTTLETLDIHPFSKINNQHNIRLKLWRAQTSHLSQTQSPETSKSRDKSNMGTKGDAAIEQVLRCAQAERQGRDDSSVVASVLSVGDGSEMKKEMSIGDFRDSENVKLFSSQCDDHFIFPRQTISLSGVFSDKMSDEGFDGEIMIDESSEVMKMLGAWMSRDLDFEITIENCENLLRLADRYEIPRLEKDVIPHLYSLSLDPFDAYTYGKVYSIPNLARQHEPHILSYFADYTETHFHRLAIGCPEGAVDLVKEYVKSVSGPKSNPKNTTVPNKKFKEWLEATGPI